MPFCPECNHPNYHSNATCQSCGFQLSALNSNSAKKGLSGGVIALIVVVSIISICGLVSLFAALSEQRYIKVDNTNTSALSTPTPIQSSSPVQQQTSQQTSPSTGKSYEYMLASLDKGYNLDEDDITVNRFRFLLDKLEAKTQNTRQQIADMTVNSQKLLREKYGKEVTLLELMEQANKAIPETSKHTVKYEEIISMVAVLMGQ